MHLREKYLKSDNKNMKNGWIMVVTVDGDKLHDLSVKRLIDYLDVIFKV